jgi:spermidine/putrescine transport system ATP-binding protein
VFVTHDQGEALSMADRVAIFNDGKIVQIGAPAEIYERPKTRFVAGFLGVSNLLPATSQGRDNGYAAFKLSDGSAVKVPAALVQDRAGGLALGVRPEKIRLIEPKDDVPAGLNSVPGTVAHASYLGVSTQYIVRLRDGHQVTVYEQNVTRATKAELGASGEEVILAWSPEHCFVVEDTGGQGAAEPEPEPAAVV